MTELKFVVMPPFAMLSFAMPPFAMPPFCHAGFFCADNQEISLYEASVHYDHSDWYQRLGTSNTTELVQKCLNAMLEAFGKENIGGKEEAA